MLITFADLIAIRDIQFNLLIKVLKLLSILLGILSSVIFQCGFLGFRRFLCNVPPHRISATFICLLVFYVIYKMLVLF